MLAHATDVVIGGRGGSSAIAIDTVEMKLYFEDNKKISRAHFDGTGIEVVIKDVNIYDMAIDWIGRRIFWTTSSDQHIFKANLDGHGRREQISTITRPRGIAVDPTSG